MMMMIIVITIVIMIWSSDQNFFVSGRYRVQISVRRPAILMFICCYFVSG